MTILYQRLSILCQIIRPKGYTACMTMLWLVPARLDVSWRPG